MQPLDLSPLLQRDTLRSLAQADSASLEHVGNLSVFINDAAVISRLSPISPSHTVNVWRQVASHQVSGAITMR